LGVYRVGIIPTQLIEVAKLAAGSKAKVVYVSKDQPASITKGTGGTWGTWGAPYFRRSHQVRRADERQDGELNGEPATDEIGEACAHGDPHMPNPARR
jgi:hypothetical protein